MAEREIKTGVGTYTDEKGVAGRFGFKGDKVKVHEDDLERFDELNVDAGDEVEYERVGVEVISPTEPTEIKPEKEESASAKKAAPAKKAT